MNLSKTHLEDLDPKFDGRNLTNRVLFSEEEGDLKGKKKITYYCPAYIRIKIKNFADMNLANLEATVNTTMLFTVNLRGIQKFIQSEAKKKLILRFNRNEPLELQQQSIDITYKQDEPSIYSFTVRKLLLTGMETYIRFSPFERIYLILEITVQSIEISHEKIEEIIKQKKRSIKQKEGNLRKLEENPGNKQQIEKLKKEIEEEVIEQKQLQKVDYVVIRFNLMDFDHNYSKISYTEEGTFGEYDLAERALFVEYTNKKSALKTRERSKKVNKSQKEEDYSKILEFQNSFFQITLYKFPIVSIFTIFVPLWLLGIINLAIFFQDTGLADRIASISALMIAFVALTPVIRSQLPPAPDFIVVEAFVYAQTLTTLFCLIQSIRVRQSETYEFIWYENGLFWASAIIQIFEIITVVIMIILFQFVWLNQYNKHVDDEKMIKFDYKKWNNIECDQHFRRKCDLQEIKILKVPKDAKSKKKNK